MSFLHCFYGVGVTVSPFIMTLVFQNGMNWRTGYRIVAFLQLGLAILLIATLPGVFFVRTTDYFTSLGLLIGAILAIHFERRFVNYRDTRSIPAKIVRAVGAFAIYFGLNTLLKLPFSKEFLAGASFSALLVRAARYTVTMFVIMGLYPKVFPLFEKIGNKRG